MLWPTGQISKNGYNPLSQLLHSSSAAVRSASSSSKIIVHLANGWNRSAMLSFFQQIFIPGAFSTSDYDVMAFSMYPFYNSGATLSALRSSLTALVSAHGKVSTTPAWFHASDTNSSDLGCLPRRNGLACLLLCDSDRAKYSKVGCRTSDLGTESRVPFNT